MRRRRMVRLHVEPPPLELAILADHRGPMESFEFVGFFRGMLSCLM
jgi:hypothetical protein